MTACLAAALVGCDDPTAPEFRWNELTAFNSFACAVTMDGVPFCYGPDALMPVGNGPGPHDTSVFNRVDGGHRFARIFAGTVHACALTFDGEAYCWGRNLAGEIGDGTRFEQSSPSRVVGGHRFRMLALGSDHTCGLDLNGAAWCWGENTKGQLGDSTGEFSRSVPVAVAGGLRFREITADLRVTCGITESGAVYCWGNYNEFLPESVRRNYRSVPHPVPDAPAFDQLGSGRCGLTSERAAYCWTNTHNPDGSAVWHAPVLRSGNYTLKSLARTGRTGLTTEGQAVVLEYMNGAIPVAAAPVRYAETLRFDHFDGSCGVTPDQTIYCATLQTVGGYIFLEVPKPR